MVTSLSSHTQTATQSETIYPRHYSWSSVHSIPTKLARELVKVVGPCKAIYTEVIHKNPPVLRSEAIPSVSFQVGVLRKLAEPKNALL